MIPIAIFRVPGHHYQLNLPSEWPARNYFQIDPDQQIKCVEIFLSSVVSLIFGKCNNKLQVNGALDSQVILLVLQNMNSISLFHRTN